MKEDIEEGIPVADELSDDIQRKIRRLERIENEKTTKGIVFVLGAGFWVSIYAGCALFAWEVCNH